MPDYRVRCTSSRMMIWARASSYKAPGSDLVDALVVLALYAVALEDPSDAHAPLLAGAGVQLQHNT